MILARKPARRLVMASLLSVTLLTMFACARTPQQKAARFMESGKKHMAAKDYARAVLEFQNAVQILPKDPEPYYQLGLVYLERGSLTEGIAAMMKVTQLDSKHVGAQIKLAELMARSPEKVAVREAERRMQELLS